VKTCICSGYQELLVRSYKRQHDESVNTIDGGCVDWNVNKSQSR